MSSTTTLPIKRPSTVVLLAAGSLITSIVIGVRITFGLYMEPVVDALGTDRGTYALAIAIQNLLWGLTQPIAGAVADRFGAARVLAVGAVGYLASMVLLASANSTGMLLFSAGVLVGISTGAASFAVVLSAVGRMVPPARRSMALGIVTAMGSVGQFVLVPVAQRLLAATDWRTTVTIMGVILLGVVAAAPVFRGRATDHEHPAETADATSPSADRSLRHELRRAAHHRSYLLLNLAFFVCGFHVTFIGTHLPAYADDVGIGSSVAATALALVGLFNIAGSFTAGVLGGRYSKTKLLSIIYAARAMVIAVYVLVPVSATTTLVFGATFGLLWLSTVPLTSGIVVSQFGTRHSGALFGIVFLAHQLGAFIGVWLGGELSDATGSYRIVWLVALALGVAAAVCHLLIDEGPAPEPPPNEAGGLVLAPTGAAAVALVALGTTAVLATATGTSDEATGAIDGAEVATLFCPLRPYTAS